MTFLGIIIEALALTTAFAFGMVVGEDTAKERHEFWSTVFEEDPDDDGAEELDSGSDR